MNYLKELEGYRDREIEVFKKLDLESVNTVMNVLEEARKISVPLVCLFFVFTIGHPVFYSVSFSSQLDCFGFIYLVFRPILYLLRNQQQKAGNRRAFFCSTIHFFL